MFSALSSSSEVRMRSADRFAARVFGAAATGFLAGGFSRFSWRISRDFWGISCQIS